MESTDTQKLANGHGTAVPKIDQALVKESKESPGKDVMNLIGGKGLIYHKMIAIMRDLGAVGKDQQNTVQNFKFRGIDQFINELHPALVKHGVFVIPQNVSYKSELKEVTRSNGKAGVDKHVELLTNYTFAAEDGSSVTLGPIPAEGLDSGDKATNKALSSGLKYLLIQTFMVPTEDMVEGDSESPEHSVSSRKDAEKAPPATTTQPRRGGFTAPQRGTAPKVETTAQVAQPAQLAAQTPPPAVTQPAPAVQTAPTIQESAAATAPIVNAPINPPAATMAPAQAAAPATAATEPEKPKRERARFNPPPKQKREE